VSYNDECTIRMVEEKDVPELEKNMCRGPLDKHRVRFERQSRGEAVYLAAFADGIPVGHVLVKWEGDVEGCPDFEDLLVSPDYRRRGIAERLLLHGGLTAKDRGFAKVGLAVGLENAAARALYAKVGYKDAGRKPYTIGGTYIDQEGHERSWSETCIYLVREFVDDGEDAQCTE
jgi:ribosomal protein S18 acetylase RimI-like enzyme